MSDITIEKMSNEYFDVLKELGNIGAGNAMTALASILQCKVDMQVPKVSLLEFKEVGSYIGGEEQTMVGVYLAVEGDISGSMMFLLRLDAAAIILQKLMGMEASPNDGFTEMEISALKEIGNIITGAYLNALSSLTKLVIVPSVPELSVDMAGAILSVPAIEFGTMGDNILFIQSHFSDEKEMDGYFIMVPDLESYKKILQSLGII